MREKILNLLGLMRRANAITVGEDKTAEIVRAGKAKLLLLSADASDNAVRKAENLANGRNVQLLRLPFDRAELGGALGIGGCSVAAVTDLGFASAWMKLLAAQWPEEFARAAEAVESRREKADRRKSQKGSKREGTRRTNV
jgi:ribosomal protein L7Ae-like RNA K-turn-binding protein